MKRHLILILLFLASSSFGQDAYYAHLLNQGRVHGSARVQAMGGAFGALGADISSAVINPAGIGFYRKSELSLSSNMLFDRTTGNYLSEKHESKLNRLNLNQIGFVGSLFRGEDKVKAVNIAIGYNQLVDFDKKYRFLGINDVSSLTEYYAGKAEGKHVDDLSNFNTSNLTNFLSYKSGLIIPDPAPEASDQYISVQQPEPVDQYKNSIVKGYSGEYFVNLAANIDHKLYLGATLGIRSINYEEDWLVSEYDYYDEMDSFDAYDFNNKMKINGTGLNVKLGAVYKPFYWLRVGGSIETPTFYNIKHRQEGDVKSYFKNGDVNEIDASEEYDYEMTTPFRAMLSAAVVLQKQFIISADVDYVGYSDISFQADDYDYDEDENPEVERELKGVFNYKLGVEYRLGFVSFRTGGAYFSSPYTKEVDFDASKLTVSGGLGIRTGNFFADIAMTYMTGKHNAFFHEKYENNFFKERHEAADIKPPSVSYKRTTALLTMGLFF